MDSKGVRRTGCSAGDESCWLAGHLLSAGKELRGADSARSACAGGAVAGLGAGN